MVKQPTEYVVGRFILSIETLATSPGTIQERLYHAMMNLSVLTEEDIPGDLLNEYTDITNATTAVKEGISAVNQGTLAATIYPMSDDEAVAIAQRLFNIQRSMIELLYGAE